MSDTLSNPPREYHLFFEISLSRHHIIDASIFLNSKIKGILFMRSTTCIPFFLLATSLSFAGDQATNGDHNYIVARQIANMKQVIYIDSIQKVGDGVYLTKTASIFPTFSLSGQNVIDCINKIDTVVMETPELSVSKQIELFLKDRKGQSDSIFIPALCNHPKLVN